MVLGRMAQVCCGTADDKRVSRRLLIAALLGVLLFSTPALAGLTITDRQQATTDLITGPQFYALGTGTDLTVGASTNWADFVLEGLEVDVDSGLLVLGRAGDVAPSATTWHDETSTSRACEVEPAQNVRQLTFDVQREIDAGRLQANLADVRAFTVADGSDVTFRTGSPTTTSIVVDTSAFAEPAAVCVYWGNPAAGSLSNASVMGPVVPDRGWAWRVWENVGNGLSLDLVDWSTPSATGTVPTGAVPADVCNQCANELVGFVTPSISGSYRFFLSADDVGLFELAPLDDPAGLTTVLELSASTPTGDFSEPSQASEPVELLAGQAYAIRARSKDLELGDHLEIGWALEGEAPVILPTEVVSDVAGVAGTLTHRRFDLVATADLSGEPASITRIETSENVADSCDDCAHSISGYVVIAEAGSYRFWLSSDDEGTLRLSTNGSTASADRVAWLTDFVEPLDWTVQESQRSAAYDLDAGQTIWIEAFNRDNGGPDHLQVGWSRDDTEPATAPALIPTEVLSENPPVEAPLPSSELGPIEGQQAASGTFVSAAVDATPGGSNVFGLFRRQTTGNVEVEVSFANDPSGPWSAPVDLVAAAPAPLDVDGLRYVRFSGLMTSTEDSASVTSLGLERDLTEAVSSDATTTVSTSGVGDQIVLRVRGSIGTTAIAEISGLGAGSASFTLASASASGLTEVSFGNGTSHHVVVSPVPGTASATARWAVSDSGGAIVFHDITVFFD